MNITINDLETNTTLDQAAMTSLFGGFKRYGSWRRRGISSTGIRRGATHMSNYWVRKGRLFKRNGHQHGSKIIRVRYVRSVSEYVFA